MAEFVRRQHGAATRPRRGMMLALEPRVMFDAAGLATAAAADDGPAAAPAALPEPAPPAAALLDEVRSLLDGAASQARREIVFVDAAVTDRDTLLAGVAPGAEVVLLDPAQDGVEQIAVREDHGPWSDIGLIFH